MFKVVKAFYDLQDVTETKGGRIYQCYEAGDIYPRKGLNPSEGRIAELAGTDNAQGQPLIAVAEVPAEKKPVKKRKPSKKPEPDE